MHRLQSSFHHQVSRLDDVRYPHPVTTSIAEKMLRMLKKHKNIDKGLAGTSRTRSAVIQYIHAISHSLKKVGKKRARIRVVFSAPKRLRLDVCKGEKRSRFIERNTDRSIVAT